MDKIILKNCNYVIQQLYMKYYENNKNLSNYSI